jgi:hypothetical protein
MITPVVRHAHQRKRRASRVKSGDFSGPACGQAGVGGLICIPLSRVLQLMEDN